MKRKLVFIILKYIFVFLLFVCFVINSFTYNSPKVNAIDSDDPNSSSLKIDVIGIENFTDVKYIENSNYFKANPLHAENDTSIGTEDAFYDKLLELNAFSGVVLLG